MTNQLFFLSLADIFSVYPTIFKELIARREVPTQILLPSDADWQERVYYRLLEVQKRVNETSNLGSSTEDVTICKTQPPVFDPSRAVQRWSPSTSPDGLHYTNRRKCVTTTKIALKGSNIWSLDSICKAAKLLKVPPLMVHFESEHEMRKVYSLIYDVFRYKFVLSNALNEISFFENYPQFMTERNQVWIMLYELYVRHFTKRNAEEVVLETKLYREAHVDEIAECLWKYRIRLAASISRMRIKYGAHTLNELLPIHLRNEKVAIAVTNRSITGWINPFCLRNRATVDKLLCDLGFELQPQDAELPLASKQFQWDNVCSLCLTCIPDDRSDFTKLEIIKNHSFIMQDKTFSYGPAIMSRLLDYFQLDGDILQTHIVSPRSTAYLAALFSYVHRVNNFYVYGAGANLKEYRKYMETLGITNVRIYAESFTSFPLDSKRFASVVGIFATPPNSYSAIFDPIDLICSRGGDLKMLEILTESEVSNTGKNRISLILEEQLFTLQMAMSRPQIQFILYETHSIVKSENQDMVKYAIKLMNEISLKKHRHAYRERKRLEAIAEAEIANIPSAAFSANSPRKKKLLSASGEKSKSQMYLDSANIVDCIKQALTHNEDSEENVVIPDVDEFVEESIPDICTNQDNCVNTKTTSCFMSLIRRKTITYLNAKYLIQMAENRGLFGKANTNKTTTKTKVIKTQETHTANTAKQKSCRKNKKFNINLLMKRLMQQTSASYIRSLLNKKSSEIRPLYFNFRRRECYRHVITSKLKFSHYFLRTKYWWHYALKCIRETKSKKHQLNHLNNCKKTLTRYPYPIHIHNIRMSSSSSST